MKCRCVLCVVLLSACTSTNYPRESALDSLLADMGYRPGQEVAAIDRLAIRSWQYVDARHLVVSGEYMHFLLRFDDCKLKSDISSIELAGSGQLFTRVDPVILERRSEVRRCAVVHMQNLSFTD